MIYLGVRHLGNKLKRKVNNHFFQIGSGCEIHWVSLSHYDNLFKKCETKGIFRIKLRIHKNDPRMNCRDNDLAKYYFCFRIFRLSKIEITNFTAIDYWQ